MWAGRRVRRRPGCERRPRIGAVPAIRYGVGEDNDWRLSVTGEGPGGASGFVDDPDGERVEVSLRVDGAHNLLNATAAIVVATQSRRHGRRRRGTLAAFGGVHRRFELRGNVRGAAFYDDYGHVPTELAVTLAVAAAPSRDGWWRCSSPTATRGRRPSGGSWERACARPTCWW